MKKITTLFLIGAIIFNIDSNAYAKQLQENDKNSYENASEESDEDVLLSDAVLISSDTYTEGGKEVICDIYLKPDGTKVIDTLAIDSLTVYSTQGTKSATRTREITGWGTVTLTANFTWYTEIPFSYVKCTYADYSFSLDSKVALNNIRLSYTKDYVSIGKASAKVSYYMYNKTFPAQFIDSSFKITCTDTGVIGTE